MTRDGWPGLSDVRGMLVNVVELWRELVHALGVAAFPYLEGDEDR